MFGMFIFMISVCEFWGIAHCKADGGQDIGWAPFTHDRLCFNKHRAPSHWRNSKTHSAGYFRTQKFLSLIPLRMRTATVVVVEFSQCTPGSLESVDY